jgi:ketosteroid isomerase-like protein
MGSSTEVVKKAYEAFGRGDIPAVLGLMDPQIRWHQAEGNPYQLSGEAWVGPDAVMSNLFQKLGQDWAEFAVKPSSFHEAGAVVTVEGRYAGKHRKTGKSLDCQMCHVMTVENGKITKFQQYVDTAQLKDVMGAS